jgi:hypothetical protein
VTPDRAVDRKPDEIVSRVNPDAGEVVTLFGFLGPEADGYHRVYANARMREWIRIHKDDIVHRERIPGEDGGVGGRSTLWVRRAAMDAPLSGAPDEQLHAEFLTGPFASGMSLGDAADMLNLGVDTGDWCMPVEPGYAGPCQPPCRPGPPYTGDVGYPWYRPDPWYWPYPPYEPPRRPPCVPCRPPCAPGGTRTIRPTTRPRGCGSCC